MRFATAFAQGMLHGLLTGVRRTVNPPGTGRRRASKYMSHQGKRECARRRRQMERGMLG